MKIHLDTDLGSDIDDLCALAMLLKWPGGVEITGITTVAEDGGRRAGYVRRSLALAGRSDIPVVAGADGSVGTLRYPVVLPDEGRYWQQEITPAPAPIDEALLLLKRSVEAGATVIAIGPYTNLRLFDQAYPGLLGTVPLYIMGGHVHPIPPGYPRWTDDADWNVQSDVAAAAHVLERFSPTVVPIEITVQTALRRAYLPALKAADPLAALIAHQAEMFAEDQRHEERYGLTCSGLPDDLINFQHDPLACALALGWDGVTIEETGVRVELRDGWLHEEPDPDGHRMRVVTAVDAGRFDLFWVDVVTAK
jgi:inosine-uridine nucleoside N-ribohydrolase